MITEGFAETRPTASLAEHLDNATHLQRNATMSASTSSSATDVDAGSENEAPQLSALFLIKFDKKIGYVVASTKADCLCRALVAAATEKVQARHTDTYQIHSRLEAILRRW